jgi:predicted MFS family arabinose efflux permease
MVEGDDLSNAVALNSSAYNSGRIIGPAIAGLLIASIGGAAAFLVNSFTYLIFILALAAIRIPKRQRSDDKVRVIGSLKDGFKYILGNKTVIGLMFIVSVASFLTIPYITFMPVFARDILEIGADGLGFLMTAVGVGAIIGAMLVAYLQPGKRGNWLVFANIFGPIFLIVFCVSKSYQLSLLLVLLVGASNSVRLTLANSLTQLNTSSEFHGRVMSIFNLLFNGMSRIGALVIGGVADVSNVSWSLGLSAGISAIIGFIIFITAPHIRELP